MWAHAGLASGNVPQQIHPTRPKTAKKKPAKAKSTNKKKTADSTSVTSTSSPASSVRLRQDSSSTSPPTSSAGSAMQASQSSNITDLLEPAIDGPPSPQRLRALSNQMRRGSVIDKHQSHQTTSSGSSSLRSLNGDRPSWENSLEGISLSRKSSGRSTSSSMPSRERPESVQIFGKTIFNRRVKLKRENSGPGPLGGSVYPPEAVTDMAPTSAGSGKDAFMPGIFGRRKGSLKPEPEETDPRKRFQISGPYNFQHVTHSNKDEFGEPTRASRAVFPPDYSPFHGHGSQMPTDYIWGADFDEPLSGRYQAQPYPPGADYSRMSMNRPPPPPLQANSPRRFLARTQSQEQMRPPPPRPARSPIESSFVSAGPMTASRMPGRIQTRYDGSDVSGAGSYDRPLTSGGFHAPLAFSYASEEQNPLSPSHGYSTSTDLDSIAEHRYSRVISPAPDDVNWPLASSSNMSFDTALADVPEEEESNQTRHQSRVSVTSNSSLRGSHSVPLMRKLAQTQEVDDQRPLSGQSDTLGRFDLFAAQRALRASLEDGNNGEALPRASWEDDIDYAYEHALEADCDYAWERASLDMVREEEGDFHPRPGEASPMMLTPGHLDVPALSPVSQGSNTTAFEPITPVVHNAHPSSNFSMPRGDAVSQRYLHARNASYASSFRESHGFNLSPTLLIPNSDYHEQMRLHEAERSMSKSGLYVQPRNSASTTGSDDSIRTSSERHVSTASTALTRLSDSTTSLDQDGLEDKSETPQPPVESVNGSEAALGHVRGKSEPMTALLKQEDVPTSPAEARDFSTASQEHGSGHRSKKSRDETAAEKMGRRKESSQTRRQRARTASVSNQLPPTAASAYALFPVVR